MYKEHIMISYLSKTLWCTCNKKTCYHYNMLLFTSIIIPTPEYNKLYI